MPCTATVYNIQHFSIHDGPGIRTTVFFKGCPLGCWWCHNPESRAYEVQEMWGKKVGTRYTTEDLLNELLKDRIFYEESGGGVTFSGGEPLAQIDFLAAMLEILINEGIHTAVDTSGFAPEEAFRRIMPFTDLFLFDLKIIDNQTHIRYTEKPNNSILENLTSLLKNGKQVVVRIPLVPEITMPSSNLDQTLEFLKGLEHVPEINLLPYHKIASGKYDALGMENKMNGIPEPTEADLKHALKLFQDAGFPVKIGG